jgi:hypothetical protein
MPGQNPWMRSQHCCAEASTGHHSSAGLLCFHRPHKQLVCNSTSVEQLHQRTLAVAAVHSRWSSAETFLAQRLCTGPRSSFVPAYVYTLPHGPVLLFVPALSEVPRWRTASGDAPAAATASPQRARGTAARGGSAAPQTAAAGRARQSTLRVDQQADAAEARISVTTVCVSVGAAKMLGLQLFLFMNRREAQRCCTRPAVGVAGVHIIACGRQGFSPVQLHTQPATYTSSSSNTSAGSSSGKKGSSKKAARAQQASSSRAAVTIQQGSMVPPHHLQVLQAAGVPAHRLMEYADLGELGCGGAVPTAAVTVTHCKSCKPTSHRLATAAAAALAPAPPAQAAAAVLPAIFLLVVLLLCWHCWVPAAWCGVSCWPCMSASAQMRHSQ